MSSEEFVDQILTSLKVISMIKEGQKVKVRDGLLSLEVYSTGVMTGLRRWINRDNRLTTLRYIRNTVIQAMTLSDERVTHALKEAMNGLNCLAITYGDDAGVTAAIDVIKDRIRSRDTHPSRGQKGNPNQNESSRK